MQLTVNNQPQNFIPIQIFRERWNLPDSFKMDLFEAKEWDGLGSLEKAGQILTTVRQRTLDTLPDRLEKSRLIAAVDDLTWIFRRELEAANTQIGLRSVEIDYAVSGFHDMLQAVAYRWLEMLHSRSDSPTQVLEQFDFSAIYRAWLDDSVRVSTTTHDYEHGETRFLIRIVYYIYGRLGFEVETLAGPEYVLDTSLACPASSYMRDLCTDAARALGQALTR
jgi:hypothetical protein